MSHTINRKRSPWSLGVLASGGGIPHSEMLGMGQPNQQELVALVPCAESVTQLHATLNGLGGQRMRP